jgi:phospholipid-translocating ATPase
MDHTLMDPNLLTPEAFQALRRSSSSPSSTMSRKSVGVMDWTKPTSGGAQWQRTLWKKLEVGDLVFLRDNEQVPADLIVISTSNADSLCFIETKNLDGETNLKIRKALKGTAAIQSEEDLEHSRFYIDSEPPHANLYTYNGVLKYHPAGAVLEKQEAVTINELLLRGCSLRNTKWVIGLVVITGADTKIMLNGGDTPSKRSKIEKETSELTLCHHETLLTFVRLVSWLIHTHLDIEKLTCPSNVVVNFIVLFVLCATTAILRAFFTNARTLH